jgi:subtilisin family serine protease
MEPSEVRRRGLKLLAATAVAVTAGAMAAGSPASAAPAEGEILGAGAVDTIAGSYIVALKGGVMTASSAQSLAGRYGGSVKYAYTNTLRGFAANMSEAQAKRLAADPAVDYVEADQTYRISDTQANPPSWGLDRVDQRDLPLNQSYTYPNVSQTVRAYILDTGILTTHNTFRGRAVHGRDFVDNDANATDCHGHGTHVAGTVGGFEYGVAKTAQLVAVRVLGCTGSGSTTGIIAAIDWVAGDAAGRPAVANMSLGGGASASLDAAVTRSIANGITYALAAGNENQNACNVSPARTPNAITVGATTITDARASFSNWGTCVDIFAPGNQITSSWYSSTTATNTISGTSMASPHAAGAAALLKAQNPSWTPQQIRDAMVAAATPNKVTNPGTNSPNRLLFVGTGVVEPPPPGCSATNATDVQIPDLSTVFSDIAISGCNRNASASTTVEVHIVHTYRGDLVVALIAPDGSAYTVHSRSGGSADNLDATFTVNASSEAASGTWRLRVQDAAGLDTGYINSWTLTV